MPNMKTRFPVTTQFGSSENREKTPGTVTGKTSSRNHG